MQEFSMITKFTRDGDTVLSLSSGKASSAALAAIITLANALVAEVDAEYVRVYSTTVTEAEEADESWIHRLAELRPACIVNSGVIASLRRSGFAPDKKQSVEARDAEYRRLLQLVRIDPRTHEMALVPGPSSAGSGAGWWIAGIVIICVVSSCEYIIHQPWHQRGRTYPTDEQQMMLDAEDAFRNSVERGR